MSSVEWLCRLRVPVLCLALGCSGLLWQRKARPSVHMEGCQGPQWQGLAGLTGEFYKWSHDMGVGWRFRMGGGGTCILDWAILMTMLYKLVVWLARLANDQAHDSFRHMHL